MARGCALARIAKCLGPRYLFCCHEGHFLPFLVPCTHMYPGRSFFTEKSHPTYHVQHFHQNRIFWACDFLLPASFQALNLCAWTHSCGGSRSQNNIKWSSRTLYARQNPLTFWSTWTNCYFQPAPWPSRCNYYLLDCCKVSRYFHAKPIHEFEFRALNSHADGGCGGLFLEFSSRRLAFEF